MPQFLNRLGVGGKFFEVHVQRSEEISEWLLWGSKDVELRLVIPIGILRAHGAFSYSGGVHPFVEALKRGPGALSEYYDAHRPSSIAEAHFTGLESKDATLGSVPWVTKLDQRKAPGRKSGEKGLDRRHGSALYGPCTEEKVALEMRRLQGVLRSIKRIGWRPSLYGDIRGMFLRNGDSYRFYIRSGKHRAAALAVSGYEHIQITFSPNYPRVIDIRDSDAWPLVRRGLMTEDVARAVFQSYFDFDGSQQYHKLGLNSPELFTT